eukprot:TRINITY_DN17_c0_g2_i10.p1 TRINITY_DN17_c0_g2~~TRINITY_DN17_c0_g2_i10.p1  ORF type:complete len:913 (-),score=197.53 TRINITY_DN17_c0_g2_i10:5415-8153(-)
MPFEAAKRPPQSVCFFSQQQLRPKPFLHPIVSGVTKSCVCLIMPPLRQGYKRSESLFHQKLTKEDREDLLKLQTLRDLPKSRYATRSCITAIPSGRGRKAVFSHIEVYKMVEEIAKELREAGVRPQTACAFVLENGVEAVIYFLALQWIGAIAVPIDPKLCAEDITKVLQEVNAVTLVSADIDDDDRLNDRCFQNISTACEKQNVIHWHVCRSTNKGVYLDRKGKMAGGGAAWAGGAGDFKYDPNEKCIRFAIGENGEFLVFELSHRGAAEATREFSKTYSLRAEDVTILVADIHSMQGLMCVLAAIYSGGNVVISQGNASSVSTLLQHGNENGVTWISADCKLISEMHDEIERDKLLKEGLKLSFVRSYGGNFQTKSLESMEAIFRAPILQSYGTPESCGLVSSNRDYEQKLGTCGKAISGCDILIFDTNKDEVVGADTHGRIGVRGPHISMYYVANDYANQASYIELLDGENSGYYFLTGDEGFVDERGFLTISKYNDPCKRAAMLAAQQEDEVKSKRAFEAARVAQLAEEERRREMEAKMLQEKIAKEKEEAERLEAEKKLAEEQKLAEEKRLEAERQMSEERRQQEEREREQQRKLEEERLQNEKRLEEERQREAERRKEEERLANEECERKLQDQECERSESTRHSEKSFAVEAVREVTKIVETEKVPDAVVDKIMERLDAVEDNQKRFEQEMEDRYGAEMEQMRERIKKLEDEREQQAAQTPREMEEMRCALEKAAASAESSSRDTAAAAQAAKEAAAAAATAASVQEGNQKNVMEIRDPGELQKTIMVSLEDVDQAMRAHTAIKSARAFGRPDARYGAEVFCAVKAKKGARVSEPWLMLHAQSMLPAAFVPKKFFFKEDLRNDEDRSALSNDQSLKGIAELSGFANEKIIKSPTWIPQGGTPTSK